MLLLWGSLQPHGTSRLASIRFNGPVRIRSVRIYPKGVSVFTQNPETASKTQPDAFSLSVFLNAQAAPTLQEPKPKGTNVLVPTTLHYPGGLREFPLDMGPDFVTRLMVIQGDFDLVTLAVYGEPVSDPPADLSSYVPSSLPSTPRYPLLPALDPANTDEPSSLSRQLLDLIPHAPPIVHAIRLMFCLRPSYGECNSDQFANLEECVDTDATGLDWLERAVEVLKTPIHEAVDVETVKRFAEKTFQALTEKSNDHLYVLAGVLRYASAQPEVVVHELLEALDLPEIFEINLLDKHILERLHDAAANPSIAQALNSTSMFAILQSFRNAHTTSRPAKQAASSLQQRVLGWERFEKALTSSIPDISAVALWIKELASEDLTCGVFLLSMLQSDFLSSRISRLPIQQQPLIPMALWDSTGLASFSEFTAFLKAFVGVACVMVALCWANYVADTSYTERILAMLRLWQEIDGYREIVNHLFFLPQLIYRLEGVLKNATSLPSLSVMYAEQLVACLCVQQDYMTRPELASLVDALPPYNSSISEVERSEMAEVALVAEHGLSQAIHTIFSPSSRPIDATGGHALQAALLVLEKMFEDRENGEWNVMHTAWQEGSHGLPYRLVEVLEEFVYPIQHQFLLTSPPPLHSTVLARLISSSNATMRILSRLLPGNPLPNRLNRSLIRHIMTLFIATDAVDSRYPQAGIVRQAARIARPTCADTLSVLVSGAEDSESSSAIGQLILRILCHAAIYPEGDDPVLRVEQVFWLLDLVLPLSISDANGDRTQEKFWIRRVIPNVLPELQRFSRALTVDHQVQFMERLTALDRGEIGLGQWFIDEELKYLLQAIGSPNIAELEMDKRIFFDARAINSIQFLTRVVESHPTSTSEYLQNRRTLQMISQVLNALADYLETIPYVVDLACAVAPHADLMELQGRLDVTLILLRSSMCQPFAFLRASAVIPLLGQVLEDDVQRVAAEFGPALQRLRAKEYQSHWQQDEESLSQAVMTCLSWLLRSIPDTLLLPGISENSFNDLMSQINQMVPDSVQINSGIGNKLTFSDNIVLSPPISDTYEPLTISYNRLGELLTARPRTPPTPRLSGESIFKMATLSPIAALVGSSRISTLTKTYLNNDFRQLSARQNTSRRPSMHVDDFEQGIDPSSSSLSPPLPPSEYFQLLPSLKLENE